MSIKRVFSTVDSIAILGFALIALTACEQGARSKSSRLRTAGKVCPMVWSATISVEIQGAAQSTPGLTVTVTNEVTGVTETAEVASGILTSEDPDVARWGSMTDVGTFTVSVTYPGHGIQTQSGVQVLENPEDSCSPKGQQVVFSF